MSKRDDYNYEPIDLNKGIALECERNEFGHTTHTLWVDGEVYQITENAWEKLQQYNFERFDEGKEFEKERLIKLLESDLCGGGKPALSDDIDCDHDEQTLHLIELIKGETNE